MRRLPLLGIPRHQQEFLFLPLIHFPFTNNVILPVQKIAESIPLHSIKFSEGETINIREGSIKIHRIHSAPRPLFNDNLRDGSFSSLRQTFDCFPKRGTRIKRIRDVQF